MTNADALTRKPKARILIVDDHPVAREGLAFQIGTQHDLEVCGEAEDVGDALKSVETCCPDVAIIDVSLKTGNGIDLVKRIRAHNDTVRILVWSMHPENLYAERALRAGAIGYIHKSKATSEIIEAIRAALAGKVYLSPDLSESFLRRLVGRGSPVAQSPLEMLSDREIEMFGLLGKGCTTQQIADKMHISIKTVETYRLHIKEKLKIDSVVELVHRATQWVMQNE